MHFNFPREDFLHIEMQRIADNIKDNVKVKKKYRLAPQDKNLILCK